jgi:hypothetical protein
VSLSKNMGKIKNMVECYMDERDGPVKRSLIHLHIMLPFIWLA